METIDLCWGSLLAAGGLVYAWGGNEYGQCGVHWGARDVVEPTPCVPSLRVVQVAAGGMHSCVLTNQGEVRARDCAGIVGTAAPVPPRASQATGRGQSSSCTSGLVARHARALAASGAHMRREAMAQGSGQRSWSRCAPQQLYMIG